LIVYDLNIYIFSLRKIFSISISKEGNEVKIDFRIFLDTDDFVSDEPLTDSVGVYFLNMM
jgi:hypothetical protein